MAQAGFTPISLYFSSTAAAVPTSGNLANGELALNIADMKLYAKNSAGVVTLLASNASTTGVDSLSFGSTGLTPSTATTGAITVAGTLATTNGGTGLSSFTANRVLYTSSTSAIGQSANLTFDGTTLVVANFTDSSLTATRVTYAGTAGNLTDSANLTFDGSMLALGGSGNVARFGDGTNTVDVRWRGPNNWAQQLNTSTDVFSLQRNSIALWSFASNGALGIGATPSYGTSGQVLTSGGSGAAPTWTTNGAGTVTSITVAAGTGMSGGGTVTTSGTVTLTNAGVTSVTGGTGISVSASTGGVTITSTVAGGSQAFVAFGSTGGW
jgi:hypothetical protein